MLVRGLWLRLWLLLLLRKVQQGLGEAATSLLLEVRHLLLVVLLLQVAAVVRQMPRVIATRPDCVVLRRYIAPRAPTGASCPGQTGSCAYAAHKAQTRIRLLRVGRENLIFVGGERRRGWVRVVSGRGAAGQQLVPVIVGMAGGLAQVGLGLDVVVVVAANGVSITVASGAHVAVAAATVVTGGGALEQRGGAVIERGLGAFLQQIAAAQLRQVVVVAADAAAAAAVLVQMLQQSQAAHAAVALHRRRRGHRRNDIHIRQAGRVALRGERERGISEEVRLQLLTKREIVLNQCRHEQLPAEVPPHKGRTIGRQSFKHSAWKL